METTAKYIQDNITKIDGSLNELIDKITNTCDINILSRHSIVEYLINAKQDLRVAYKLNEIYIEKCECESNCKNEHLT